MTTSSGKQEPLNVEANFQARHLSADGTSNKEPEEQIDAVALGKMKKCLAAERESYLRLAADFDNFKKRTAREAERRALEHKDAFILELLPVVDNLERALAGAGSTAHPGLHEGVKMTLQQLIALLRKHGLDPELPLGQLFDPHKHEAMRTRTDAEFADQTVLDVWQRGWRRGDVLFRPAKVVVNDLNSPTHGDHNP